MGHLQVFAYFIVLIVGIAATFVTRQIVLSEGSPLFRRLHHYITSFNLMVFGYLAAKYAHTNLIGENPFLYPPFFLILVCVVAFAVQSAVAWTVLRLGWEFRYRLFPPALARLFLITVAILGSSYSIGITLLIRDGTILWLGRTQMAMGVFMMLAVVAVFSALAVGGYPHSTPDQRRSARVLGGSHLLGYLAFGAFVALPEETQLFGTAAAFLWLNLTAWIWVQRFSGPYRRMLGPEEGSEAIARLAAEHGITAREREIIELIVRGKSNKEIEAELTISFSTVKNHVYNVYRKLGVNSRGQLMYLVVSSLRPSDPSRG
jgi:DNA-binding CsgD family transcriptional regulator